MLYPGDKELSRLAEMAQRHADGEGKPYAVINLNRAGNRMLVVRTFNVSMYDHGEGYVRHRADPAPA